MSAWGNVDWYILAAAWVVTGAGALLGLWALAGDRARGRKRCPRCWYDMSGATSLSCPECGRDARHERRLFRTRRRWRCAALAIFVILAGQSLRLWPGISRDGWLSPLPMWALMHALPITGMDGSIGMEFQRRLTGIRGNVYLGTPPPLSIEERAAIIRRCARGNALARPVSERWQRSYGALLKQNSGNLYWRTSGDGRVLTAYMTGEDSPVLAAAVEELSELPPVLTSVYTRERWPAGMPVSIRFEVDYWWPLQCFDDVAVRWSANGGPFSERRAGRLQYSFDIPATGKVELDLDIDIRQEDGGKEGRPRRVMANERRQIVYEVCDTVEEALPRARDEALDQLLSSSLRAEYSVDRGLFWLEATGLAGQGLDDVAFGAFAEILHNGEVIDVRLVWWQGAARGAAQGFGPRVQGLGLPWREAREYIREHKDETGWEMRLRSDPESALSVLEAERYWEGEARFPMTFGAAMGPVITRPVQVAPAR